MTYKSSGSNEYASKHICIAKTACMSVNLASPHGDSEVHETLAHVQRQSSNVWRSKFPDSGSKRDCRIAPQEQTLLQTRQARWSLEVAFTRTHMSKAHYRLEVSIASKCEPKVLT